MGGCIGWDGMDGWLVGLGVLGGLWGLGFDE